MGLMGRVFLKKVLLLFRIAVVHCPIPLVPGPLHLTVQVEIEIEIEIYFVGTNIHNLVA